MDPLNRLPNDTPEACGSAHGANLASPDLPRLLLGKHERQPPFSSPTPQADAANADAAPSPCARLLDLRGTQYGDEESAEGATRARQQHGYKLEPARSEAVTHLGETARRCVQRRVLDATAEERGGRRTGRRGAAGRNESEERRAAAAAAKGWRGARRGGAEAADAATGGKGAEAMGGGMAAGEGRIGGRLLFVFLI